MDCGLRLVSESLLTYGSASVQLSVHVNTLNMTIIADDRPDRSVKTLIVFLG